MPFRFFREETNSKLFSVERSKDALHFTAIGQVNAQGFSDHNTSYSFTDENPPANTCYYRLRLVDADNSYEFSEVRKVASDVNTDFIIYPNPATNVIHAEINSPANEKARYTIFNMNGIKLSETAITLNKGKNHIDIPLASLAEGIYYIKLFSGKGTIVRKISKIY